MVTKRTREVWPVRLHMWIGMSVLHTCRQGVGSWRDYRRWERRRERSAECGGYWQGRSDPMRGTCCRGSGRRWDQKLENEAGERTDGWGQQKRTTSNQLKTIQVQYNTWERSIQRIRRQLLRWNAHSSFLFRELTSFLRIDSKSRWRVSMGPFDNFLRSLQIEWRTSHR